MSNKRIRTRTEKAIRKLTNLQVALGTIHSVGRRTQEMLRDLDGVMSGVRRDIGQVINPFPLKVDDNGVVNRAANTLPEGYSYQPLTNYPPKHMELDTRSAVVDRRTAQKIAELSGQGDITFVPAPPNKGCELDSDGDGNCHVHPNGCPPTETLLRHSSLWWQVAFDVADGKLTKIHDMEGKKAEVERVEKLGIVEVVRAYAAGRRVWHHRIDSIHFTMFSDNAYGFDLKSVDAYRYELTEGGDPCTVHVQNEPPIKLSDYTFHIEDSKCIVVTKGSEFVRGPELSKITEALNYYSKTDIATL